MIHDVTLLMYDLYKIIFKIIGHFEINSASSDLRKKLNLWTVFSGHENSMNQEHQGFLKKMEHLLFQ